ncbi:sporulation protein YqfD [Halanaerobaculum tunisiense]
MFNRLYEFWRGYLRVKITGQQFTKLINELMREGIKLWDIVRIDDTFYANINLSDFKELKNKVRTIDCKVAIYQKKGLPFWWTKLLRRRMLAVGILIVILTIYILSQFVLFIEVTGTEKLSKEEITSLLEQVKIQPGVLKSNVPLDKLRQMIIQQKPEVSWANAYFKGTKLVVEVVEKELIDTEVKPADIVAAKSGVISELIVLRGTAQVEEGTTVSQGDILISKNIEVKKKAEEIATEEESKIEVETKQVKAAGLVKAQVWYEGYGEAELVKHYQQPTGNYKSSLVVKVDDREFVIKGPTKPPYANFVVQKDVKSLPQWRNQQLPIEVVIRKYVQVKEVKEDRSLKQAKQIAKEKAVNSILQGLDKEAIILNSKLELITRDNNQQLVRVKALVEVEEEIGVRRE